LRVAGCGLTANWGHFWTLNSQRSTRNSIWPDLEGTATVVCLDLFKQYLLGSDPTLRGQ